MARTYIWDLEGTLGIFSSCLHANDMIVLRPGVEEVFNQISPIIVATRAPKDFAEEVCKNLYNKCGIKIDRLYTREDLSLRSTNPALTFGVFKDYKRIYREFGIEPEDVAVVGDLLKIFGFEYDRKGYVGFDFKIGKEVLAEPFALNDHPVPYKGKLPVYAVVPEPWTAYRRGEETLSLDYVVKAVENGIDEKKDQVVISNLVSKNFVGVEVFDPDGNDISNEFISPFNQTYIVLKGDEEFWRPLEERWFGWL